MAEETAESARLLGSKIGAMILFLFIGLVGAFIPVYLKKMKMNRLVGLCNAFAGGAFLALGLFHILPDAVENLEGADIVIKIGKPFNAAYILAFVGYIMILFCEAVLFDPASSWLPAEHHASRQLALESVETRQFTKSSRQSGKTELDSLPDEECSENTARETSLQVDCIAKAHEANDGELYDPDRKPAPLVTKNLSADSFSLTTAKDVETTVNKDSWFYAVRSGGVFLMLALALHGIFEGIIVGTTDDVTGVWMMTLVIFGHKWAESFALMTQFLDNDLGLRWRWLLMATFVISSPIGVGAGIAAASQGQAPAGVFNALGAGTVFFVAGQITTEVFLEGGWWRYLRFLVYNVGAFVVLGLSLVEKLTG